VQRQADIDLTWHPDNDAIAFARWKLCDNGFAVDEGRAEVVVDTGHIDWRGHPPPAEDEGLLRTLILERLQSLQAGS